MGTWGNESKYLRAVGAIGRVLRDSYGKASGMCVWERECVWVRLCVCVCMCVYCVCACVCSKYLKAVGAIGRVLRGSYGKASGMCVCERERVSVRECVCVCVCVCVCIVCVRVYVANIWGLLGLLGECSVAVMVKHLVCVRESVCVCVCASVLCICLWQFYFFGLPTMRRLHNLFRQFWKIALFLQGSLVEKQMLFKEPTHCCCPI